jgi:dihydrofolate reductase/thymidylate synthase
MKHFLKVTTAAPDNMQNAVIMGRKTWESIPPKFRPLSGRINVILSSTLLQQQQQPHDQVIIAKSLLNAMEQLQDMPTVATVFLIGGAQVYKQALDQGLCNKVIYTNVSNLPANVKFDAFFPDLKQQDGWTTTNKENGSPLETDERTGTHYQFLEYTRTSTFINKEEMQYLNACRTIMDSGARRGDRTGTGTLSVFGTSMRFSLRNGCLPLLTTKRTFWRGVAEELLWFIKVRIKGCVCVCERRRMRWVCMRSRLSTALQTIYHLNIQRSLLV